VPRIRLEPRDCRRRDSRDAPTDSIAHAPEQGIQELVEIRQSVAQRRQRNAESRQDGGEIAVEAPLVRQRNRIVGDRGDHPDGRALRHRVESAKLREPVRLRRLRQLFHLIEIGAPPLGERAPGCIRSAFDPGERMRGEGAQAVDVARHRAPTRPPLSSNQHRRVKSRQGEDPVARLGDRGALPHQNFRKTRPRRAQDLLDALQQRIHALVVVRKEVRGARLAGVGGDRKRSVGREEDDRHLRMVGFARTDAPQQRHAVRSGHAQIRDHEVEALRSERRPAVVSVLCRDDAMARLLQVGEQQVARDLAVVYHEDQPLHSVYLDLHVLNRPRTVLKFYQRQAESGAFSRGRERQIPAKIVEKCRIVSKNVGFEGPFPAVAPPVSGERHSRDRDDGAVRRPPETWRQSARLPFLAGSFRRCQSLPTFPGL
jgi:hypothetical protein